MQLRCILRAWAVEVIEASAPYANRCNRGYRLYLTVRVTCLCDNG